MRTVKNVKTTHALLILGGLSLASYDVRADATSMAQCMVQCAYLTSMMAQACAGRPVTVLCYWNDFVPPPCYVQVKCG
jgi:hypothetical protein